MLHFDQEPAANGGDFRVIAAIVEELQAKFGADALKVALLQQASASPESAAQWSEVVSRLSA